MRLVLVLAASAALVRTARADACLGVGCPGFRPAIEAAQPPPLPWASFLEVDIRVDAGSFSTDAMDYNVRGGALAVGVRMANLGIFGEMSMMELGDGKPAAAADLVARFGGAARYTLVQSDADPDERRRRRSRLALWVEAGLGEELISQSGTTRERGDVEAAIAVQLDAVRGKTMTSMTGVYLGFRTTLARGDGGIDPSFLFILGQGFGGALY